MSPQAMPSNPEPTSDPQGSTRRDSLEPLALLLAATVLLIPLDRALFGMPIPVRLVLGAACSLWFVLRVAREDAGRRRLYLALAACLAVLAVSPLDTRTDTRHMVTLGIAFALVLILPLLIVPRPGLLIYRFWPRRLDRLDVAYTLLAIPLSWAAFELYFGLLSPEVPTNWYLPPAPEGEALLRLFGGINAVGIWDELFFVNTCYALLRALFPYRIANPAQAVVYTAVLYDMAFSGWGPVFVYALALTQGAMYERSRVLLWVLLVHLIVDYFLFQAIVTAYYPGLDVWWH